MTYLKHLDEFQCQRCLNCCTNPGYIYISTDEASKIAQFLDISETDFLNNYCDLIQKPRLTLKTLQNGTCIMLKGNACGIHPVKPVQCQSFPVKWRTQDALKYCSGLKVLAEKYGS